MRQHTELRVANPSNHQVNNFKEQCFQFINNFENDNYIQIFEQLGNPHNLVVAQSLQVYQGTEKFTQKKHDLEVMLQLSNIFQHYKVPLAILGQRLHTVNSHTIRNLLKQIQSGDMSFFNNSISHQSQSPTQSLLGTGMSFFPTSPAPKNDGIEFSNFMSNQTTVVDQACADYFSSAWSKGWGPNNY